MFSENMKYLENVKFNIRNHIGIKRAIRSMNRIILYYSRPHFLLPSEETIIRMNNAVKLFSENVEYLKGIEFKVNNFFNILLAVRSMKQIFKFLTSYSLNPFRNKQANRKITMLKDVASVMTSLANINPSNMTNIGGAISNALSGVNAVDMDQVEAVTNMFNAFNKISKSENVINKFTESVKEFTETCKNLMDAMGNNTDAINNIDMSVNKNTESTFSNIKDKVYDFINIDSSANTNQTNGIRITNVDEVARAIAEKINGALSVDVPDTQVQLLINGTGGNEWTISRY
jgi:hypothetical protein